MVKCLLLCGKSVKVKGKKEIQGEEQKIVRWAVDKKEDWGREKKCR